MLILSIIYIQQEASKSINKNDKFEKQHTKRGKHVKSKTNHSVKSPISPKFGKTLKIDGKTADDGTQTDVNELDTARQIDTAVDRDIQETTTRNGENSIVRNTSDRKYVECSACT